MGGLGGRITNIFTLAIETEQPFTEKTDILKFRFLSPGGTFRKLIVISFEILETALTVVITPATDTLAVELEIPSVVTMLTPSGRTHL